MPGIPGGKFKEFVLLMVSKILISISSLISIGFGIWHFFVPKIWNWYSYIEKNAIELVIAIRAINVFFSLSLVLFGLANIVMVYSKYSNKFSVAVLLSISSILWITRSALQIIYPQGSMNPLIQYGMLFTFLFVTTFYLVSLCLILWQPNI